MKNGVEAFRSQLQKELGLSTGPKDPLLALWVSQKELLEQNAAQQQKLLNEFQAALEAARMNAAAVRQAFDEGASRIEHSLAAGPLIAWLSLTPAVVVLTAAVCAIVVRVIH